MEVAMSDLRSNIRGDVFPLVIDQADIEAPGFPRPQEWWDRFMPLWVAVDVQDDGTVLLDYNGWNPGDQNDAKPGELTLLRALADHVRAQLAADGAGKHGAPLDSSQGKA
jgi:hypothetical protein